MKDRIKQLMESQHMTQQVFSNFIGISSASLSSMFTGRTNPTLTTAEKIKEKFPTLSLDWLIFGKGPMFHDDALADDGSSASVQPSPTEGLIDFGGQATPPSLSGSGLRSGNGVHPTLNNQPSVSVKYIDKPQRQITEIRIFFDDQTWESFVPKK